ncbi:HutD family protein [Ancylobacter sp. 6x-1]|uniref:HutD family protein n=1 Tax=Ancylobacter crimeensis TaxID=2579147 RepID=A0ABT0DBL0_9HYPH|nr:HutD family protein [Ancylobacter crimeensis]MCK0197289.1 HutD family protein [Ancylobacter crimeensis]
METGTEKGITPRLQLIRPVDHRVTPWKNGAGVTRDVLLLPEGAGHEDFDIRISLAPIPVEGPFSSFPGIDRHITLLHGSRLELVFANGTRTLLPLAPLYFDSAQAPTSRLPDGPVEVLNIMTRRGRWTAQVMPLTDRSASLLAAPAGGHVVLHAAAGTWRVSGERGAIELAPGDTLVTHGEVTLSAAPHEGRAGASALAGFLAPVRDDGADP